MSTLLPTMPLIEDLLAYGRVQRQRKPLSRISAGEVLDDRRAARGRIWVEPSPHQGSSFRFRLRGAGS